MSLITQCPSCHTHFKVVPDQLRVSDGWVRCGHCSEIFDAAQHLLPEEVLQSLASGPADLVLPEEAVARPDSMQPALEVRVGEAVTAEPQAPEQMRVSGVDINEERVAEPVFDDFDLAHSTDGQSSGHPPDSVSVSFLTEPTQAGTGGARWVTLFLLVTGVLLALILALQVVVHERDRIAAVQPATLPWLHALCRPLNCTVGSLRQIESLSIDGAAFNRLRNDTYRLSFSLKNGSNLELAAPSVELALTDPSEQVVLRRVLTPAQLGLDSSKLAPGVERLVSVAVAVKNASDRFVGYRLYAFYP